MGTSSKPEKLFHELTIPELKAKISYSKHMICYEKCLLENYKDRLKILLNLEKIRNKKEEVSGNF